MSQETTNNSTSVSELGEFKLIDRIKDKVTIYNNETVKGIGDDAAVIASGKNLHLISTDLLVEGVHFDLAYTPLKHLGYKAVIANISDICKQKINTFMHRISFIFLIYSGCRRDIMFCNKNHNNHCEF